MRNRTPTVLVALLAAVLFTACATVAPGNDPVLVNAERSLKATVGTLDTLFKTDYQNWQVIDPVIPQWKDAVNALRVAAPPVIDAANGSIKAYRAALALKRADPSGVTQEQLNALATELGNRIVEAVNLGKKAADVITQWTGKGGGK
jgi:ABC-type amino acid transport substrate-binding protein